MTRLMGTALGEVIVATDRNELAGQMARVGLASAGPRPVIVLMGGASNMSELEIDAARPLIRDGLVTAAQELGAAIVDGGTDAGAMALVGQARAELAANMPLVGVAPLAKVRAPGIAGALGTVELEPHHTHFVLAPGDQWGDELLWIADVATTLSNGDPVAAVVVAGGNVTAQEADEARTRGWPMVIVRGSGGTADVLAEEPAASDTVVDIAGGANALRLALTRLLGVRP